MVNYDARIDQMPAQCYTATGSNKRKIGATLAGAMVGMSAYYIPVTKDLFVNKAFNLTKNEADKQIAILKSIAEEVANRKVSTESKMILQDMGLAEDITDITNKCTALDKSVSEPTAVKSLKQNFSRNFESYKKNIALMDNICAKAFQAIKQNRLKWGIGIGAGVGLALSLMTSRD